mmetsp:Transcript_21785/g.39720  ORF Transcript_21785/g.39720 Transcript_21785/m.39720 type:complete len:93 (-) Transcript_21785:374-652(-)
MDSIQSPILMTSEEKREKDNKMRQEMLNSLEEKIVNQGIKAEMLQRAKSAKAFRLKPEEVEHKLRWLIEEGIPMRSEQALNLKMLLKPASFV